MTVPLAHVEFDYDLDDLADVMWRAAEHSPTFHFRQRRTALVLGAASGLGAAGLVAATARAPSPTALLVVGLVTAAAVAAFYVRRLPALYRRAARRHAERRHGAGPFRCVIELHADHALCRQPGLELQFAWPQVLAITIVRDDVEIRARSGVMVVRGRGFADAAARERFVAAAQRLQRDAATRIS